MTQPNIILVLCDQFRGDAFGADGNRLVQTPNIDYLAAAGTRFGHAYSAVPSCLPARATLMTGQNQWHAGILGMGRGQAEIPNDFAHTLAGELTAAGYRTHLVGKAHFHPQRATMGFQSLELDESGRMPTSENRRWFRAHAPQNLTPDDHGVDWNSWHARPWHTAEHLHPTFWTMSRAIDFLRTRDQQQPFFLNISFARPHSPYVPPPWYFDLYFRGTTPAPFVGTWAAMHDDPLQAANPNAWRGRMTAEQIHRARSGYYGEISFIDTQLGRLLNYLKKDETAKDNTWILFTSDHGDMQGDHNLWRKTHAYEGSSRIPFIVTPPNCAPRPGRNAAAETVELRDIMPTVLEAAGLAPPPNIDGRSVLPLLGAPARDWREYIHGEHCTCYSHEQEMQFVTDGRRKYIWLPRIGRQQFFDLEQDPGECVDLIAEAPRQAEIAVWRERLAQELDSRDCGWVKNGSPHCPGDEPMVSPFKNVRWTG